MASPGNQHCANCIDALSFPTGVRHRSEKTATVLSYQLTVNYRQTLTRGCADHVAADVTCLQFLTHNVSKVFHVLPEKEHFSHVTLTYEHD